MLIIACGIARGRVCTTTVTATVNATELPKMTAILQPLSCLTETCILGFVASLFDIGHPCQLICQNEGLS